MDLIEDFYHNRHWEKNMQDQIPAVLHNTYKTIILSVDCLKRQ